MSDSALLAGSVGCLAAALACFGFVVIPEAIQRITYWRDRRAQRKRLARDLAARAKEQEEAAAVAPLKDGAELGYYHPEGYEVRIVEGIPVAVAPLGGCYRWSSAFTDWIHLDPENRLAKEARERIRLEQTRAFPRYTRADGTEVTWTYVGRHA